MGSVLDRLSDEERGKAADAEMPDWVDPMLAKLTHTHFSDPDWIFERKLDGVRAIAYVRDDGSVRLMSRNRNLMNERYPEIEEALERRAPAGCILDGEIVTFDEHGVTSFQKLQARMHASSRQAALSSGVEVYCYLFDCMYIDGHDLSRVGLRGRKKVLREAVEWEDPLRLTEHRNEDGEAFLREACESNWEGLIAKKAEHRYVHGRSSGWLKFKCVQRQEFVIGGFTEPEGERIGFGALLIGFYRDGHLVYAGKVGTGYDDKTLRTLHERLSGIERDASPFDVEEVPDRDVHFVDPELVCEVEFTEWTSGERLRHPSFIGLRTDKDPEDVRREAEAQVVES